MAREMFRSEDAVSGLPGWRRIPYNSWRQDWPEVIPDVLADEVDQPILVEWLPSRFGGWAPAAVWVQVQED